MFNELKKVREALERQNALIEAQQILLAEIVTQLKRIADSQAEIVGVEGDFSPPTHH